MDVRAIAFDVNGTLVHILTDEGKPEIFRAAAHLLSYQGISLPRGELQEMYFRLLDDQLRTSPEEYPEFDAVGIWQRILDVHRTSFTDALPAAELAHLPLFLAELARGISRHRLGLYPYAREVLDVLRKHYPLAVVTDAQTAYARAELNTVGLLEYFHPIVVSGDHGYRKPDPRLFLRVVDVLGIPAAATLYVGNDMYRDVYGARQVGMATVMVDSDQGEKSYPDCVPDHTICDLRELLAILDLPSPS